MRSAVGSRSAPSPYNLLVSLVLAGVASGATAVVPIVAPVLLLALLGAVALVGLVRWLVPPLGTARNFLLTWTLAGLLVHVVFAIAIWHYPHPFKDDAIYYHQSGIALAAHWDTGSMLPVIIPAKTVFIYFVGSVYWALGSHAEVLLTLYSVLAAAVVPLVYDSTRRLFGEDAAPYGAAVALLLPGIFLWTSMLLLEALILFAVAVAVNAGIRLSESFSIWRLFALGMASVAILGLRPATAYAVGGGTLAGAILARVLSTTKQLLLGCLGIALAVGLALGSAPGTKFVKSQLQEANDVRASNAALATSSFDPTADISDPRSAVTFLGEHFAEALAGPFPWSIKSSRHALALVDVAIWWCLLPALIVGVRRGLSHLRTRALVLLTPALAMLAALTLAIGDFGTLLRQRPQAVMALLPFLALGLSERAHQQTHEPSPSRSPTEVSC